MNAMRQELSALVKLAAPIAAAQLGWTLMGAVDIAMIGNYEPSPGGAATDTEQAMAAVCIGNAFVLGVAMPIAAILMALDPLVAQAYGAKRLEALSRHVRRGWLVAAMLAVPVTVLVLAAEPMLRLLRQPPDVVPLAADYAKAALPGSLALLAYTTTRQVLQAVGSVWPLFVTVAVANVANATFNVVLIEGRWGFPELGPVGTGWASSASRVLMAILLWRLGRRVLRSALVPHVRGVVHWPSIGRMFTIGIPIALQVGLEIWIFIAVTFLMGQLGEVQIDGHQVAIQLAALAFMVPLAIGAAAATRVGQALGRRDFDGTRRAAWTALALGTGVMTISAVVFVLAPAPLARVFTHEPEILALAITLLPIAAAFQLFDGAQVVALGVLRGAADTKIPAVINLLGYWALAFPLGYLLTFRFDAGARGLWWGLTLGLATVAVLLVWRIRRVLGRLRPLEGDG